jgi:GntR family transcriptional regulator, transcriptional repressor for pyruvate dehydrogenase complex
MIQNTSRVDQIASDLQAQILAGKLTPGEKLPSERSLSGVFNVGRTTIREALKSLVVRGVVTRSGRGVVVADPENVAAPAPDLAKLAAQVSIKQLYEVRKLIEVRIAGWAALRATPEDVAAIRSSIDADIHKRTKAGNPNRLFHDALVQAVHNPALEQIYESGRHLFFRLPFYWQLFESEEVKTVRARRHELARRWHQHILEALIQRDAAEAEGSMFQHLDIMEKDLLGRLRVSDSDAGGSELSSHPMLAGLGFERTLEKRSPRE